MGVNKYQIRHIGQWDFEGGGFVKIIVGGNVSTADALVMVDVLVGLKRDEMTLHAEKMIANEETP